MLKKIKSIKHFVFYIIICLLILFNGIIISLEKRLDYYDGWQMYFEGTEFAVLAFIWILFSVCFVVLADAKKINFTLWCLFITFSAIMMWQTTVNTSDFLKHFNNSIILKNIRYDIESIELNQLLEFDKYNYILYVGRDNCSYCEDVYPLLEDIASKQPVRIFYYNTIYDRENNKEEMASILNKYNVQQVPSVIFIVDGKWQETLSGDEIYSSLGETIHNYKQSNIFFNKDLIL